LPPIVYRPGIGADHFEYSGYNSGNIHQVASAPNQMTVYNQDTEELQGKAGSNWLPIHLPPEVVGTEVGRVFNSLAQAIRDLAFLMSHGIPRWRPNQFYNMHARVIGSDGKIYKKLRSTNANPDPVTESADPRVDWALDNPWMDDIPAPSYKGVAIAGGHVHSDGTLVTGESWGVSSVSRSGADSDSYLYTVILNVPVDDNEYYVQAHSIVDVTDVAIIPIIPSDPPCFTVQFEKRVNANTIHEGIARAFYFAVYGK